MQAQCCIAGGGPAGMMLGLLLARAGVEVVVLEKHADFLRDFRGDTIHPSTLEVMGELGLLEQFLERPHQEVRELRGVFDGFQATLADLRHLPARCGFIALMPQWDFLDFLKEQAQRYPRFHLHMEAEVTDLIEEGGVVAGMRAKKPGGPLEVRAPLTVGADGRHSVIRARSGLTVREIGAPIDVLWMQISRREDDPGVPLGRVEQGRIFVMIYRGDYWQCGYVILKGTSDEIRRRGIESFREEIAAVAPFLSDRLGELGSFDDVKLLTVKIDRLETWYRPGLLCIGDAAHAMSPVGGVGINLAIQDAVAAANELAAPLGEGAATTANLRRIQRRRALPTRLTQRLQVLAQDRFLRPALGKESGTAPPWTVRMLERWPLLRRVPARLIGIGFRPEHIRTREGMLAEGPVLGF